VPPPPPPPVMPAAPVAVDGYAATITAPAVDYAPSAPGANYAPPPAPARGRRRGQLLALWALAAVVLVVIAVVTKPSSGGGATEKFGTTGGSPLTPVKTFTPQTLHEAILAGPFPQALLPPGFSFEQQKSPGGKPYAARAFATQDETDKHHLIGAAVVALASATPGASQQISFLSFAEPDSAEAYMQEARNDTAQVPPGQPVCGVFAGGQLIGCSIKTENVVVEGRIKSTTGQPIADPNAGATATALAQAGVTYVTQIKGG
jgi:hypothetical protein